MNKCLITKLDVIVDNPNLELLGETFAFAGGAIRNGSLGNPGNANAVSMTTRLNISGYHKFIVGTDRPALEGSHYEFIAWTYSSEDASRVSWDNSDRIRELPKQYGEPGELAYFDLNSNEKTLAVGLFMYSADRVVSPLRISDFEGYNIFVHLK